MPLILLMLMNVAAIYTLYKENGTHNITGLYILNSCISAIDS